MTPTIADRCDNWGMAIRYRAAGGEGVSVAASVTPKPGKRRGRR